MEQRSRFLRVQDIKRTLGDGTREVIIRKAGKSPPEDNPVEVTVAMRISKSILIKWGKAI